MKAVILKVQLGLLHELLKLPSEIEIIRADVSWPVPNVVNFTLQGPSFRDVPDNEQIPVSPGRYVEDYGWDFS